MLETREEYLLKLKTERLEYGRNLRESPSLIKCVATVEYADGTNWQEVHACIPPKGIDDEGYVEEVWINLEEEDLRKTEANGETHLLLFHHWLTHFNLATIDRFQVEQGKPILLPSPNLVVKYRINDLWNK